MSKYRRYKAAFRVACELLNGDYLYGYDTDTIFAEIMAKEGLVASDLYEKFILDNLDALRGFGEGSE
jgi:hypothetical protein